jgi:hypothetical protein
MTRILTNIRMAVESSFPIITPALKVAPFIETDRETYGCRNSHDRRGDDQAGKNGGAEIASNLRHDVNEESRSG